MPTVANSEAGIEQLLHADKELLPPKSLVENARLKDYAAEYKRSVEDPEAFWAAAANELEWFRRGRKFLTGSIRRLNGSRAANSISRITALIGR